MTNSNILIYQSEDGQTKIQTRLEDETVWLTIEQMSELFQKSRSTINEHILNIYKEGELEKEFSLRKIGNSDFSTKPTNFSLTPKYKEQNKNELSKIEKDFIHTIDITAKKLKH